MSDEQKLLAACSDYRAKLDALEAENAALNETTKKHVAAYYELLAQNAALKQALDAQADYQRDLRADRDRLDWLMTQKHIRYPFAPHDDGKVLRERIDAAMGEGKL